MSAYIDYDDAGIVAVRCMMCDATVAERIGNRVVRLANWRQGKMDIVIGGKKSFIEPILCTECSDKPLDAAVILPKVLDGWEGEYRHLSRLPEDVIATKLAAVSDIQAG